MHPSSALAEPHAANLVASIAASTLNLTKVYGSGKTAVRALDGISVNFGQGTFTAIMGPSGSGKSTLMHCLAGLDSITSGHVFLGGQDLSTLKDRELTRIRRDKIGFVFQSFNLLPTHTALQNILLPLDLAGTRPDRERLDSIVASLGLADRLDHRPSELSGGQQQRVAIARALITRPDVVFADEPTGALDSKNGHALLAYLRTASQELGQTIVMVTHDPIAAAYADRVLLLNDGLLVDDLDHPDADTVLAALKRWGPEVRTALVELRQHPGRMSAVILAISISVAFVVACLVFTATETHAIGQSVSARTSSSDVVVQPAGAFSREQEAAMARLPGVTAVEASYEGYTDFASPGGAGALSLDALPSNPRLQWATLSAGRWPTAATELAIDQTTAQQYGLVLGQQLTFAGYGEHADRAMQVTGITDQSRSLFSGLSSSAFVAPSYFTVQKGLLPSRYLVLGDGSVAPQQLSDALRGVVPADSTVQTAAEATAAQLNELTRGADVFRYLLLVFGAIALLVGAIIITNTFTILVAQRRRQIGLLRAVGASTTQVRRGLLAEAVLIGFTGSLVGVGLGIGIATAATAISGSLSSGLQIQPEGLLGAAALGLVVTLLAALAPAARATRVPPLEALRPVADEATARRGSARLRNVAFLVIAIGALLVIVALRVAAHNLVLAIGGSAVLAVGILLAAPAFLPLVLRGAGRLTGRAGPVARLAGANTVRNPGRAAATCVALMLGVGLIVTLQVGSASIKSTMNDTLDAELPVDVTVTNPSGALLPAVVTAVREADGLKATTAVPMVSAGLQIPGQGNQQVRVAGLAPDAAQVVAAGFEALTDQVVLAQSSTLKSWGISAGDTMNLTYDHRSLPLVAVRSDVAPQGVVVVTERRLHALDPQARVGAVWGAATVRTEAGTVMAEVRKASGQQPGLEVGGSLEEAAALDKVLDSLLAVATGLLAVAVLIALIGVGNTLGLSVIERTRESALLRALGLQRRELRLMLAVEAALLALVGAVVGIAAGMLFGLIGTAAMVKEAKLGALHFAMSAGQTVSVVLIAILAGVLASVLPARRAAQASPTQALAEV